MISSVPIVSGENFDNQNEPEQLVSCNANRNSTWTVGLIYCTEGISQGYTLFSPMAAHTSYLIDELGQKVHSWTSPGGHRPGLSAYMLEDGSLLRTANLGQNQPGEFTGGGSSGKVERISWEGDLLWSWSYSSENYRSHHDIEPLPNGNFLMIAWEYKNETEAAQAGKNPENNDGGRALGTTSVWPDHIIEVQPFGTDGANIVWKWHFWDHMIQDYDPSKNNYGIVSEHPELLDVNFIDSSGGASGGRDWLHCNGIDYNEVLDQIAISCKNTNEIYIIDHSTTIEQAAGHTGGNSGMGGDILYRYGNPESYQRGGPDDQKLFAQHDVRWIERGYPGEGNLMIFNNGNGRSNLYSSVDVIETPINGYTYNIGENESYGPANLTWEWNIGTEMYSSAISGSTRLANGNTLITFGMQGTLIEVNLAGEIVWKYISPVNNLGIMNQGDSIFEGNGNKVFKVERYDMYHPALKSRILIGDDYIETWIDQCPDDNLLIYDSNGDGCKDDADNDGITDLQDLCSDFDDNIDVDNDLIPDGCDDFIDSDNDGVSDNNDICNGNDDNQDQDNDSIPDGCDNIIDSDNDGVEDSKDLCNGYDDGIDIDNDSIIDGCDDIIDTDNDGISDDSDICDGYDDLLDVDNDTIPDGCDELIDSDGDDISDSNDICFGGDDKLDLDNDGIPNYCDLTNDNTTTEAKQLRTESINNPVIIGLGLIIISAVFIIRRYRA